ncbi:MAG TPA: hypothetical protein DEA27_02260, partial [Candidatus Moranbacteria bacterium]|nr:hypothetical protein [Candidatus Moranbacteria bacterium]
MVRSERKRETINKRTGGEHGEKSIKSGLCLHNPASIFSFGLFRTPKRVGPAKGASLCRQKLPALPGIQKTGFGGTRTIIFAKKALLVSLNQR